MQSFNSWVIKVCLAVDRLWGGRWEGGGWKEGVGEVEVGKEGGWEGWRGCLIPACYKEGRRRKCLDGEKFGGG